MLSRDEVQEMADLFFNGQPEEAYKMISNMNEWDQFTGSVVKSVEEDKRVYYIMRKSDMTEWVKRAKSDGPDQDWPTYDVSY